MKLRNLFLGTSVLAGALTVSATAMAQTPAPANPANNQAAATATPGTEVEAVIVTGTRIKANAFNSTSPVQVITAETTELHGIPDAAAALLQSTAAAGSFQLNDQLTGFNTTGGGGTQTLSLRGLGTQRTLTLLNGKRAGPAGVRGQVQAFDLNVTPQAQVDRFDILKDGASSIYGSDAVAGVVNIITKRNINGGAVNGYASVPTDTGGAQYRLDGVWGHRTDQYYYTVGAEYYNARPLRRGERADTACAADNLYRLDNGQRADLVDPRTGNFLCVNLANGYVQTAGTNAIVGTGINLVPTISGVTYPSVANGNTNGLTGAALGPPPAGWQRWGRGGYPQTYGYAPYSTPIYDNSTIISPVERATLTFNGGWFLSEHAELYTELLYNKRISHQLGAAQIFQSFSQLTVGPPAQRAVNAFRATNPNNPLGVDLVTVTAYYSEQNQDVDYYRGVLGLRGDFNALGTDWDYDLYGQYSLSDATYDLGPRMYLDRWFATSGPNVACNNNPYGGNVSGFNCSALPNGVPWASTRVLNGQFTPEERSFLFFTEDSSTTYSHAYIEGLVSTKSLFKLPAGDVGAAIGFQSRHEAIDDTPGPQALLRNVALVSTAQRTKGSDTINEVFGELQVPLLADKLLAKDMDLNVSGRISDYKSFGTAKTYKVGLNWSLSDEYRIRASTGTSFRAPALYELYLGSQIGFLAQSQVDPCINYATNSPGPSIEAACAALGIPGNYTAGGSSSAAIASIGGLGRLKAETAQTYNVGFVWTPKFAPISVAVDYFDITIRNSVDQYGAYEIISRCMSGETQFCPLYNRDATSFNITTVDNSYVNIAQQKSRGIDVEFRYTNDLPWSLGRLTVESTNTWKLEDAQKILEDDFDDILGRTYLFNGPQYAGNLNFTVDHGPFTYFYGVDMIGHASDAQFWATRQAFGGHIAAYTTRNADVNNGISSTNCAAPGNYCTYAQNSTNFVAYHSASVRYRHDDWTFQLGMQNLFDTRPPVANFESSTFRVGEAWLNGYDMRGRRIFVRVGTKF